MKKGGRYRTNGLAEDSFEPGSRGRVLKNKLGITGKRAMDEIEAREQFRALNEFLVMYERGHRFTAKDICRMHEIWLGNIYEWAGRYRLVNISKENFTFAMARQVPVLMEKFEKGPLSEFTPCLFTDQEELIHAVAVVHTELVLIHPFREGNGRLARMLAVLMGLQAGLPPFDFGGIKGRLKQRYFAAVQAGMEYNYVPMETIFRAVLARTLQQE
jgi:cell filamentation protein